MNVLGLKGFTAAGDISQYFTQGCFPQKWNWNLRDVPFVLNEYEYYILQKEIDALLEYDIINNPQNPIPEINQDYIIICYSDGGVVGHQLALQDSRCRGLIAHSATFPHRTIRKYTRFNRLPVLLIQNKGDLTNFFPSWHSRTDQAYQYYLNHGFPLEHHLLPGSGCLRHNFDNAFGIMNRWTKHHFSFELPIK